VYNTIYNSIVEFDREGLKSLNTQAREISPNVVLADSRSLGLASISNHAGNQSSICDLDQLFLKAFLLDPHFQRQMQTLAAAYGGCIPKVASVKSEGRAIEKVLRSYCGDVRKLNDLVRATLVFDDLSSLAACLQGICSDDTFQIHRIKNRFDDNYPATISGGYRDVCLVVSLRTKATKHLGVDSTPAEVQLAHKQVFELKSNDGHRRYIRARNLRGD